MNQFSTDVINLGRSPERFDGLVNTPVFRGSTIVVNSFSEWEEFKRNGGVYRHYGRFGAATAKSFESAISVLEGGAGSMVFPSGLSACGDSTENEKACSGESSLSSAKTNWLNT
ncbi:PLP-dependent transferase, partial [Acinetobacter nosocomialis]|nr:PLP-dependent transferase [Acinetobacter nosocomialis]